MQHIIVHNPLWAHRHNIFARKDFTTVLWWLLMFAVNIFPFWDRSSWTCVCVCNGTHSMSFWMYFNKTKESKHLPTQKGMRIMMTLCVHESKIVDGVWREFNGKLDCWPLIVICLLCAIDNPFCRWRKVKQKSRKSWWDVLSTDCEG